MNMLKRILFLLVVALMTGSSLLAQVTTAVLTGDVKSNNKEALVGATVVATHMPSGTKYTTITRSGGQYTIQNMRVGGPYTIEVSFVGHQAEKFENIFLQLGDPYVLSSELLSTAAALQNVVVGGRKNSLLNAGRTGAATNVGTRQINQLPTFSRSINEITRATPQANGPSIGGGNYRQNNFTVDGSDFNNSFGIGSNLPAGGAPISLDALDEISINITPFDIRQSGFIGSAVNAVTRSGTNTFSGSV
ncbi:MAG: carboxypeptidase regulatory-like domain-containing protein, partial [Chitinophagales bacterium]|nr:carboxypeptidase regulatory-like domain-containing protein [Chitinophagales bacterium]